MFEFDQANTRYVTLPVRPSETIAFVKGIRKRSFLHWSEHCVECAAPECYQSCDLYEARPDKRCRRFSAGMRRNDEFASDTGSSAEIVFGRWGKLESRGNSILVRSRVVTIVDNMIPRLLPAVNAVGRLVRRFGGSPPWSSLSFELLDCISQALQKRPQADVRPAGFLIEIYNPADQPCQLTFACSVSKAEMQSEPADKKIPLPLWRQLVLNPGYNRCFIEYQPMRIIVESGIPYNLSFTPETESGAHLVFITADFVTLDDATVTSLLTMALVPDSRPDAKCVVFDLDDTLWEGILVEGRVTLKQQIVPVLKTLDKRGILLSVISKNNEEEALQKLHELGILDFFIFPQINWKQKSENIKSLIGKIGIGINTLIFIDDSPFEREEVAAANPDIEVLPETAIASLLDHPRLQGSKTTESGNRRLMYQQQIQRGEAAVDFGPDYLAFLKSCNIVLTIGSYSSHHRERVVELLQRTNQLNFSGNKYTRVAVLQLLQDTSINQHVMQCRDKYGDYGLIGFALTRTNDKRVEVLDFMLSCRVQGKLIEQAFFHYLAQKYLGDNGELDVTFVSSKRNLLARSVLQKIGFSLSTGNGATLQVEPGKLAVDFLETRN